MLFFSQRTWTTSILSDLAIFGSVCNLHSDYQVISVIKISSNTKIAQVHLFTQCCSVIRAKLEYYFRLFWTNKLRYLELLTCAYNWDTTLLQIVTITICNDVSKGSAFLHQNVTNYNYSHISAWQSFSITFDIQGELSNDVNRTSLATSPRVYLRSFSLNL